MGADIVFGLMVAGIGLAVIFLLLGLLVLFLYGFSYLLNRKKSTGKTGKNGKIDAKIVAAITACISCFYFTESSKIKDLQPDFIVKSIKRR